MGKNISIYVSDSDAELFDRAKTILGESLSAAIAEAVRRLVVQEETRQEGFEDHVLEVGTWYNDSRENDAQKVRFRGRLIARHESYHGSLSDARDRGTEYELYLTPKGKYLLYTYVWSRWEREESTASYTVYDSLEEACDGLPGLMGKAREALGKGPIDLDV